jgi:AcrR family transcriptional regulator
MKPNPEMTDSSRDEILVIASGLFQRFGLDKTTMRDIAEAVGKGKSTLYHYFTSKDEVFYAVARRELMDVINIIEGGIKPVSSPKDKFRKFFIIRDQAMAAKAKLYPMIFSDTKKHVALFSKIQRESNTTEVAILKDILLEGIAGGEFTRIKKEHCDAIAITIITALHGMYIELALDGKMLSAETKLETLTEIFVSGLK